LLVSAFKPAEHGEGVVLRVANPTAAPLQARVTLGFPFDRAEPLRLDEAPEDFPLERKGSTLQFAVPAHALRTLGIF
jgi:alpha-mannosidase